MRSNRRGEIREDDLAAGLFFEGFSGERAVFENQPLLKRGREKDGIIPSGGPESSVREAGERKEPRDGSLITVTILVSTAWTAFRIAREVYSDEV